MVTPSLRWLLVREPARTATDPFVTGRDAPRAVLDAMVAEGLLVPVAGGVLLPADLADVPAARAAALAHVVPAGGVVTSAAALWVHGLLERCPVVDVLLPPGAVGGSRLVRPGARLRGALIAPEEVARHGALAVAVLARAAADAARWAPEGRAVGLVVRALRAGCSPDAVLAALDRPSRAPGTRRGRQVLAAARALAAAPVPCAVPGRSALPAPRQPVDVEDAVDAAHHREDVVEVGGVGHLEGEAGDRDAVA
ncbi:hypothetical protein SAMN05428996_1853 [Quadrisphaera sp. DSM 44207]|nr:hypothetical protein SAMN05428996_1853 [Quadrisphaera sp. DSM 44207]